MHAPMEAGNFKDGLDKPTSQEGGYKHLAKFGDNLKDGPHKKKKAVMRS